MTATSTSSRSIPKRDVPAAVARDVLGSADRCHYCADVLIARQVDHVRPLSRGGTNDRGNLVAACISCNSQKRGMMVHEWRQWREANGMSWPLVASHATVPRHYGSSCRPCRDAHVRDDPMPGHGWVVSPYDLELRETRGRFTYTAHYVCPERHGWTCGWAIDDGYYSDCPCSWCASRRSENGDKTWPAHVRYGEQA
jgi:hypothetical protein